MIVPAQIPNPYVKPKWQASVGVMESVVAYNCRKYGMPRPVLAMPMWEGAGNRAIDYSGRGNHGTITGAGWAADGLEFVATDGDYVEILDAIDPTEYTLSVLIRPKDVTYPSIITRTDSDSAALVNFSHHLYISNLSKFVSYLFDGAIRTVTGTTTAIYGKQYHVVGTAKNNDYLRLYVDGVEEGTPVAIGSMWTGGDRWNIGMCTKSVTSFADSIMCNILIFHTVLSTAQIKFISDNPYFMYRLPEELYGYSPAAVGAIMNQFQKANMGADLYNGGIIA